MAQYQICTHRLKYYRKNDYFKFNELGSEDLPITPIVNILRNLQRVKIQTLLL